MLLRFGSFELDEERFELRRDGVPVRLPPRVLEILLFLAQNPGQLITKEQLIQGIWRGIKVSESAISQSIKRARDALRHDSVARDAIATVHGRGFRFTEAVVSVPQAHAESDRVGPERSSTSDTVRPFFGRGPELAGLRAAYAASKSGQGTVVLISGQPGVGKTRLVSHFAAEQRAADADICWGGCREGQAAPPFWPWPEVIGRHAEGQDPETLRGFAGAKGAELAALVPELGDALGVASDDDTSESPLRALSVLHAVSDYFRRAAKQRPLVLVLEDLHLADAPSLMLFEALTRSVEGTRLLVVATCRQREALKRPELRSALEGQWPHLQRIELEGLSLPELKEWMMRVLDSPPPDDVVEALHFATSGLPILIENVTRVPRVHWDGLEGEGSGIVPGSLAKILSQRLANLDRDTLDLLRTAAVFGEETPIAVLASVSNRPLGVLLAEVEVAKREGFVLSSGRGRLRFSHALLRDALYQELPTEARLDLHYLVGRTFASRLEDHPEWVVPAAHHLIEAAAHPENRDAAAVARKAAQWARRHHAYAMAAQYYQSALRVLEVLPKEARLRAELLVESAEVLCLAGSIDEGERAYEQALELCRAQEFRDPFCRAVWGLFLMRREAAAVDPVFHKWLAEALRSLKDDDPLYAQLQVARAMATVLVEAVPQRLSWIKKALSAARQHGSASARVDVLRGALHCNTYFDDGTTMLSLADEMMAQARIAGSPENVLEAGTWRSAALLSLGRGSEYLNQVRECGRQAEVLGSMQLRYTPTMAEGNCAILLGDLSQAERTLREAAELGAATGISAQAFLAGQLVAIGIEKDGQERARILTDALRLGETVVAAAPGLEIMRLAIAHMRLGLGDATEAERLLEAVTRGALDPGHILDRNRPVILAQLAAFALACGNASSAARVFELMLPHDGLHLASLNGSRYDGPVCYWLGALALKAERSEEAQRHLGLSVKEAARVHSTLHVAWSEFYLAQALDPDGGTGAAERRAVLFSNARHAADKHGLAHLRKRLDRVRASKGRELVFHQ